MGMIEARSPIPRTTGAVSPPWGGWMLASPDVRPEATSGRSARISLLKFYGEMILLFLRTLEHMVRSFHDQFSVAAHLPGKCFSLLVLSREVRGGNA